MEHPGREPPGGTGRSPGSPWRCTFPRYLVATGGNSLTRLEAWQIMHEMPYAEGISEDVYGELFSRVGRDESGIQGYFASRASRLSPSPVLAFDSITISTDSENQPEARQGFSKDRDGLDTIKLLTLYSVKDRLLLQRLGVSIES